jgi:membrane protease YdiL (CAAX protease family)
VPTNSANRVIIIVALILPTIVTWVYFILLNGAPAALQQSAYTVGKLVQFALPAIWIFVIQRETHKFIRAPVWSLVVGALFGLTIAAAMAALYFYALEPSGYLKEPIAAVRAKIQSFGASSPPIYFLLAVFYSAVHSLLEEYYWRWFVFGQLFRVCQLPAAILISSVGFAAHHVLVLQLYFGWLSPFTWLFTAAIIFGGVFWAWLYYASSSLAAPWLSHAIVDAVIFAIGYTMLAS